jgi:hypothetical protein
MAVDGRVESIRNWCQRAHEKHRDRFFGNLS